MLNTNHSRGTQSNDACCTTHQTLHLMRTATDNNACLFGIEYNIGVKQEEAWAGMCLSFCNDWMSSCFQIHSTTINLPFLLINLEILLCLDWSPSLLNLIDWIFEKTQLSLYRVRQLYRYIIVQTKITESGEVYKRVSAALKDPKSTLLIILEMTSCLKQPGFMPGLAAKPIWAILVGDKRKNQMVNVAEPKKSCVQLGAHSEGQVNQLGLHGGVFLTETSRK